VATSDEDRQLSDAPRYASLGDYLRVLRERWMVIAISTILVGGAAYAYSATQDDVYEAQATLNARERGTDIGLIGSSSGPPSSPQALTAQLAALSERDTIARRTARALDDELTPGAIAAKVSSSVDPRTNLVLITATDGDPEFAAELSNAYSKEVQREALRSQQDQINEAIALVKRQLEDAQAQSQTRPILPDELVILQERLNRLQTLKQISEPVEIITSASAPGSPVSPRPRRNTVLGLLAGLFLGIILAFARDSLDRRLKTPREIEEYFGLPRIGQFTVTALGRTLPGRNGKRALDPVDLEAARIMRTNLQGGDVDSALRSLVVTSPLPGEGKSTVAMALSWAWAMAGKRTLLVECDLRNPILAQRLGLRSAPGLSDALNGGATPQQVLQPVDLGFTSGANGKEAGAADSRLVTITAGTPVPDPAELLGSSRFEEFVAEVSKVYDVVIFDSSPLLSVVDTRELMRHADAVVVCARSYQTTRDQARAAREALDGVPARLAGLVVTGVSLKDDDYSSYYRRYVGSTPSGAA
jgi:capsular exopolysaccharide synthesis family protein